MRMRELGSPSVAVAHHQAGVPRFDVVQRRDEPLQLALPAGPAGAGPKSVERVGQADNTALLTDGLRGLIRRKAGRNWLFDVERDQIARCRPNLLADDDTQPRGCGCACTERTLEPVMIGDR